MKTIKTFGNLAEAGFASSLLEVAGIPAALADEESFQMVAGMGMLGIRLQVEDADFERALLVLAKGPAGVDREAAATPVSPDSAEPPRRIPVGPFLAAAAVLVLLVIVLRQAAENRRMSRLEAVDQTSETDENHDGRPDHFYVYRNGVIATAHIDRNADGKIDEWETYDREGKIERMELDENFDGRPDVWFSYKKGMVESERCDVDFNGRPDWFVTFENGIVVRMDCRPNESSVVVRREIYEHGVLREEWVDENQDGIFDYKILVDPFGAKSERIPLHAMK